MLKNLFTSIVALFITCATIAQEHIYLSPQGNDSNKGTKENPLQSLQAALNMAISTTKKDTAYIEVAAGNYYMTSSCHITTANNRPIVVRAVSGTPRFIGGKRLLKWERTSGNRYITVIPEAIEKGFTFEQFYINSRRTTLARTPNKGFYTVQEVTEIITDSGKSSKESYAAMRIKGENSEHLEHVWPGENGQPKVSFYHKWSNSKMHVDVINKDSGTMSIGGRRYPPLNNIVKGTPYFLYDYAHAFDSPGEWYMNYESGELRYIPLAGEKLEQAECVIPLLKKWVLFTGCEDGYIENIAFVGISFEVSKFNLPRNGYYPSQAAANCDAAIELNFTRNISFTGCSFQNSGAYVMWIKEKCYATTVQQCYFNEMGAGGIKIGLTTHKEGSDVTSGSIIDNNIMRGGGREIAEGVAVAIHHSADNRVTHNDISDFYYSAISMGWKWGYGKSPACNNTIAYNHIHDIGKGVLSDLGGIYTLGEGKGNSITNNVIHDIKAADYGGWGIYTDEGSSNIVIKNNLVYRCHDGAFHQHYGKDNIIENNIFAFGDNCQMQTSRAEKHNSFTFKRNIILQERGATAKGQWFKANMKIEKNIYWSYDNSLVFCGTNSEEWKNKREKNAQFIDPLMVAPLNGDFSFKSKKAIRKTGFTPFDYTKAGVYGSIEWRAKANK